MAQKKNTEHLKLIATRPGGWSLFEYSSTPDWLNLKLVCDSHHKMPKRNWWFGWNGARLSDKRDTRLLSEHWPEIHVWVVEVLSTHKR